jgi:hypothetical protein
MPWFSKKSCWTQNVFWFSVQLLSETFLILKRIERDIMKKCILSFVQSTHYSCPISIKRVFSWQNFEIYSTVKFHENPSSGSLVVACGWTDVTNLIVFSQFCEGAISVSALFLPQTLPDFKVSGRLKMLKSSLTTGRVSNRLEFRRFGDLLFVHRHRITLHYSAMMQTEQVAETLDSQHPNNTAGRARTFYHWYG